MVTTLKQQLVTCYRNSRVKKENTYVSYLLLMIVNLPRYLYVCCTPFARFLHTKRKKQDQLCNLSKTARRLFLKCLYGQQGFYSYGTSILCKKVFKEKKLDSEILTPLNLALKFPLQPRPMKLTESQCSKRVWVSEWVVTSSQESRNPSSLDNCCFSSGEEYSSTRNKQTEVGKAMRSSSKQNKSIKL